MHLVSCSAALALALAAATASADTAAGAPAAPLRADPPPLAARYRVALDGPGGTREYRWYFYRDAQRVALLKGDVDETWHRDAAGRLRFERVLHRQQRAVDYSAGELQTLGVQADWSALSSFVDAALLAALRRVGPGDAAPDAPLRLEGTPAAGQSLAVDWLPALQLPARIERRGPGGQSSVFELEQQSTEAPAGWPLPGARASDYLRLDAADFGDMAYEPAVRLSEALDVRNGWRLPHAHD